MASDTHKLGREVNATVVIDRYDVITPTSNAGPLSTVKNRLSFSKDGQYIEYTLKVTCEGKSWNVRKRFKEIATLHKILDERFPSVPRLPEKTVMRNFGIEKIEQRVRELKDYFENVCKRRDVMNCPEVWKFLALAENQSGFQQASAAQPVQTAEVQEANFGIRDFGYDLERGILLLGAVDFSAISRLDTMIMNMKLPWEKQAMNLPIAQMSIWRQVTGSLRFNLQTVVRYSTALTCVCLAGDHGYCFGGLQDGTVGFKDLGGGEGAVHGNVLPLLRHTSPVTALAYGFAEKWLFSASKDGRLSVFDMQKQLVAADEHSPAPITQLFYDSSNRRLYSGTMVGRIGLWDVAVLPPRIMSTLPEGLAQDGPVISALELDYTAGNLFTASKEGINVWTIRSTASQAWGRKMGTLFTGSNTPNAVQWATSSKELLVGCENGTVCIFDIEKGQSSFVLQAHEKGITAMAWLDAPRRLLTASKDKTLKIWDFPSLKIKGLDGVPLATPSFSDNPAPAPIAQSIDSFTTSIAPPISMAPSGGGGYPGASASTAKAAPPGSFSGLGSFRDAQGPLGALPAPAWEKDKPKNSFAQDATDPLRRPGGGGGGGYTPSPLVSSEPPEPAPAPITSTAPALYAKEEPFESPFSSEPQPAAQPTLPGPLSANPLAGGNSSQPLGGSGFGRLGSGPLAAAGSRGPAPPSNAGPLGKPVALPVAEPVVPQPPQQAKKVNNACLAGGDSDDDLMGWDR